MNFKQNYFEIFNLPVNTQVDSADLSARYREIQRQIHPDQFAAATEQEQRLALQYTTLVNEAYEVLGSDLKRAIYLLGMRGIELNEADGRTVEPEFLMQQIELREALEEIDSTSDFLAQLDNLSSEVNLVISKLNEEFSQHWLVNTDEALELATTVVRKMQFMTKLKHEIDLREEDLLDN